MTLKIPLRLLLAFLGAVLVLMSNIILPFEINPDWEAYERIYDSGGAWLLESGRDVTFLQLMEMFKWLSPDPSYEAFRAALLFGFALFVWFVLKGTAMIYPRDRLVLIFLAMVLLGLIRFTVQIREGLALVFYFTSLGYLLKSEGFEAGLTSRAPRKKTRHAVMSWLFALLAAGTHTSGVILLFVKLAAFAIARFNRSSRSLLMKTAWVLLGAFFFFFVFQGQITADITSVAHGRSGDRELAAGNFTLASLIYWIVNGLIFYYLYKQQVSVASATSALPPQIQSQASIVAGPLAALALGNIFILKASGVEPLVIVLFVRVFDMLIAMTAFYVAVYSRARYGLFFVLLALILKGLNDL